MNKIVGSTNRWIRVSRFTETRIVQTYQVNIGKEKNKIKTYPEDIFIFQVNTVIRVNQIYCCSSTNYFIYVTSRIDNTVYNRLLSQNIPYHYFLKILIVVFLPYINQCERVITNQVSMLWIFLCYCP